MASKRSRTAYEADLQRQESPYAFYGTPLPPLDSSARDDGSYVPIWKQEVTDERGRKRLHGAFTGGFSAGYFNSVGSKEGWTPSTFVSSRTNRHQDQKSRQQKPEDFMDEEDLAEQAEAEKLQTADSFAALGSTENDTKRRHILMDIARTSGVTMGVNLLQKMGWRQGQGVGPRVRRKACLDDTTGENGEPDRETHLFAPENSPMISFNRKNDQKGLGFASEGSLKRLDDGKKNLEDGRDDIDPIMSIKTTSLFKKPKARKSGFGVGILNDTGSDDEDPYEIGPKLSYKRVLGPEKKPKKVVSKAAANPLLATRPTFVSKKSLNHKLTNGFRKCRDGRLPLDGFVLSTRSSLQSENEYPPPKVPPDWKPSKATTSPDAATKSSTPSYQSTKDAAKASTLNPTARAALLGESPLPGKSVFDFLSPATRNKLASATGRSDLPPAKSEAPPSEHRKTEEQKQADLWALVPQLDKETADAALKRGWMLYADDLEKRERYRAFLELKARTDGVKRGREMLPRRAPRASEQGWVSELREFAQAAMVFKPVSGAMASRFTTSTAGALDPGSGKEGGPELLSTPKKVEDPAEEAARMGMYGHMTRRVERWYPTRLLCKRFNVKPPAHVMSDTGKEGNEAGEGRHNPNKTDVISQMDVEQLVKGSLKNLEVSSAGAHEGAKTIPVQAPQRMAVVDVERNEALEGEKAGDDLFRAVFGSDDEDD
ncbi:DUF1604-domain-containing protein [Patellaria atrata CBS 101060]|uniref:DUF1604-domain-containing protein n=1 Tax=Patellaria atrata CBS 101060 TaxID=1346257 RepID=A0A9P4VWA6_9PEZI|nr:DUF1604-domain-containing protein [Patellaria atrata CBS 101060]